VIEVTDLTVRFGGVIPLDGMTTSFPGGICGLIGPNGAGKTTFFNVLSGFVTPFSGSVVSDGTDLLSMASFRRARWGLRRTFQTEQAIQNMSVYDNVLTAYEHTARGTRTGRREVVTEALEFARLTDVADEVVRRLPTRERRFIEVARAVVGEPKVVLLDEPAAGLPDEETEELTQIIRGIPDRVGAIVVLVDHDMALVQACCDWTAVLDFGRVIASGPTDEVLRDELVLQSYLGVED
jgi:branched-chain amino acid transport system ATP-binding protein